MKKSKFQSLLVAFPILIGAALYCNTAAAAADNNSTGLTEADRTAMVEGAKTYRRCLHKEANAVKNKYKDVRKIADVALKKCAPILDTLEKNLKARKNISPELAAGFVHYSSNTGARLLLKQLIEEGAAAAR